MKARVLNQTLVILFFLSLNLTPAKSQTAGPEAPLTNSAVVKLVKAGFKEKTIIAIIGTRNSRFDLSTERMIELKRSGISERIILAMLARQEGIDLDDSLSDDAFFAPGPGKQDGRQAEPGKDSGGAGSTDIFGSSGGFRGRTHSKGGTLADSGETTTTGSATVRIIRPPVEAGAAPKLERVATLTNDSIIELVEAGFSEGTIIRRIEKSPVEFDLSPQKLAELRKRRVTEKILSAMKAATGDAGDTRTKPASNGTPG